MALALCLKRPDQPPKCRFIDPASSIANSSSARERSYSLQKRFWRSPIRLSCSKGTVHYSLRRSARLPHLRRSSGLQNRERFRHGKTPGLSAARLPPWPRGPTRWYTFRRKSVPTLLWRPQPLAAGLGRRGLQAPLRGVKASEPRLLVHRDILRRLTNSAARGAKRTLRSLRHAAGLMGTALVEEGRCLTLFF